MNPRAVIAQTLKTSARVLIACHIGPDGDCLGAGLALAAALERLGVAATVGSADGVPSGLTFLPGADRVVTVIPDTEAFEVAVALECSRLDRVGLLEPAVARARTVVAIDHHEDHVPYAHLTDWEPAAAAVGEQVADLIAHLGVALDRPIATCLLVAIVTDTGVFRYANTTTRTLRLAAELIAAGASLREVVQHVYEEQPASSVRLLGAALARLELHEGGAVATTVVTPAMLAAAGARPEETAGIAGMLRTIAGVRLAMTFEEDTHSVRVSIRARDGARAYRVAEALGGGGHIGAAGAEVRGELAETIQKALEAARREVRTDGRGH